MLKTCPNCGVKAIPIYSDTKPNKLVTCNNCQKQFKTKDLR